MSRPLPADTLLILANEALYRFWAMSLDRVATNPYAYHEARQRFEAAFAAWQLAQEQRAAFARLALLSGDVERGAA